MNIALGVVDQFDQFRCFQAGNLHHSGCQKLKDLRGADARVAILTADDLWQFAQFPQRLTFERALRAEHKVITAAGGIEDRLDDIAGGAEFDGRAHHDHVAVLEMRGDLPDDADNHIDTDLAVGTERRADRHHIHAGIGAAGNMP